MLKRLYCLFTGHARRFTSWPGINYCPRCQRFWRWGMDGYQETVTYSDPNASPTIYT